MLTNTFLSRFWVVLVIYFGVFSISFAQVDANKTTADTLPAPHQVIENLTRDLLGFVGENKSLLSSDENAYFEGIQTLITPAINFDYIAKKVMGAYWSKATPEQQAEFIEVFAQGMIKTYGKGMANYADLKVKVLPPTKAIPEFGGAVVEQEIQTDTGKERVVYFMGKRKGETWKLINVVYEGVNLRDTSQSQFAQLASANKGDIAKTIAGWQSEKAK